MLSNLILLAAGSSASSPGPGWFLQTNLVHETYSHEYSPVVTDKLGNIYTITSGGSTSARLNKINRLGAIVFSKPITNCSGLSVSNNYIFCIIPNAGSFTVIRMSLDGSSSTYTTLSSSEPCYFSQCMAVAEENTLVTITSYWSDLFEAFSVKLFKVSESSSVARLTDKLQEDTSSRGSSFRSGSSLFMSNANMYCIYKVNITGSLETVIYTRNNGAVFNLHDIAGNDSYLFILHGGGTTSSLITCVNPTTHAILWSKKITHTFNKGLSFVTADNLGNVYVAVNVRNSPSVIIHKFDKDGNLVWCIKVYDYYGFSDIYGTCFDVACDLTNNDIYVKLCGTTKTNYLRLNTTIPPITSIASVLAITNETASISVDSLTELNISAVGWTAGNLRTGDIFNTYSASEGSSSLVALNNL